MITNVRRIPVDGKSHPFATAAVKCRFSDRGYVEEEYFVSGTANVYERSGQKKKVRNADVPYVNRVIIRRPEDLEKFSGNVVVEILNSTAGFDIDRIWVLERDFLMQNQDVYVGITSKPNVLPSLMGFDEKRYSPISWPNPAEYDIPDEKLGNLTGASNHATEDGLFWDMLIDFSKLLRTNLECNPLRDFSGHKMYCYLTGWSQSGSYMIRYINDFSRNEGKDVFDGYLAGGTISLCVPNLNQEDLTDILSQDRNLHGLDRPYIDVHTESDNVRWGNDSARQTESEWYRLYDIVGPSHDTATSMKEYYQGDPDIVVKEAVEYPGAEPYANEFPYELAFHAALKLLYDWVREGVEPGFIDPIEYDDSLNNRKAEDGNSVGGWRLPMITFPAVRFYNRSTPAAGRDEFNSQLYGPGDLYGYEDPYSKEEFLGKYGSREHYLFLIQDETDKCIQERLLLEEDREECIDRAMYFVDQYIMNMP